MSGTALAAGIELIGEVLGTDYELPVASAIPLKVETRHADQPDDVDPTEYLSRSRFKSDPEMLDDSPKRVSARLNASEIRSTLVLKPAPN